MNYKRPIVCFLLFILVCCHPLTAQNINGDTIYLNRSTQKDLRFPEVLSSSSLSPEDDSYETEQLENSNSILLRAKIKNARPAILSVKEGARDHRFILMYKENGIEPLVYNWSTLKKLEQHVQNVRNKKDAGAVSVNAAANRAKDLAAVKAEGKETTKKGNKKSSKSGEDKTEELYNKLYEEYEEALKTEEYNTAEAKLSEAIKLRPGYTSLQTLLNETKKKKAVKEEAVYNSLIRTSKDAYSKNKMDEAEKGFKEALKLKPGDQISISWLSNIERNKEKESFNNYMRMGDKASAQKQYNEATLAYEAALGIKPGDPAAQIRLADAKRKGEDKYYQELKDKADAAYSTENYEHAKGLYEQMALLRLTDTYSKKQLKSIKNKTALLAGKKEKVAADKEVARLEKEKSDHQRYQKLIQNADNDMGKKEYRLAEAGYTEASRIEPQEQYPKNRLSELKLLIANAAAIDKAEKERETYEKDLNKKYNAALEKGGAALAKNDLATARSFYAEGARLKPAEKEPKLKMDLIDRQLNDIAVQKEKDDKFKIAIQLAKNAEMAEALDTALAYYQKAYALKPAAGYLKGQIILIQESMAIKNRKDLQRGYNDAITKGRSAAKDKKWEESLAAFKKALSIKPGDKDAGEYLKIIHDAKAREDALNAAYAKKIADDEKNKASSKKKKKNQQKIF